MKKIAILFFAFFSLTSLKAQQEIQFTQFMFNRLFYNPGYTGMSDGICASFMNRNQWVGFEGAPNTQNLTLNIPAPGLGGGFGLNVYNENIGFFNEVAFGLSYAYHLDIGATGKLSLGVRADLGNKSLGSETEWIAPGGGSWQMDPSIASPGSDGIVIDASFGAYYRDVNWWAGLSSVRLIQSATEFESGGGGNQGIVEFEGKRTYLLSGGYDFDLPNTDIKLSPMTLIKSDFSKTTIDLAAIATISNRFWGGLSYRLEDAMNLLMGFYITPDFRVGYAYDLNTSRLNIDNSGSHEFFVSYCFRIEIPPRTPGMYRHPRFL